MNQNIKGYLEDAGFITYPNTDVITSNHFGGYIDGNKFEKFAELIIKDITRGILPESKYFFSGEYSEDRIKTQQELSNVIEKYFGVDK